jgi:hypothetical protein
MCTRIAAIRGDAQLRTVPILPPLPERAERRSLRGIPPKLAD